MPSAADIPLVFGEFELDPGACELRRGAQRIELAPKAFDLLLLLARNANRLVTKDEIIEALWPGRCVEESNLTQTVFVLRRALGDRGQQLLRTVPRRGYLLESGAPPADSAADPPRSGELPPLRTALPRVELPTPCTSLIGRQRESAQAAALLLRPDVRLLTLTGTGGAGKTRLAIAVAASVAGRFAGGTRFVGLSSITQPDLVLTALANVLEVQQVANRSVSQLIAARLRELGPFLLVLDNFEQVLAAAALIPELLAASPSLKVLVTSRACLRLYAEQEFPVAPLDEDSAMALFEERARAVRPNFAITADNRTSVREVCSRLDGLPLAIELAAARTRILSPVAILERLRSRLQLLTGGAVDLPQRQQTLRNTVDWSHDLLNAGEQKLLRRFSVFAGGATLEAVEAVCNTASDLDIAVVDGL
jgi:DNA-binding winged helix-turn-helix (wHTH) protein